MTKFGKLGQRVLKIIHLFFVCLWVGGAVGLNLMLLGLGPARSGNELLGYNLAVCFVDDLIIIPGAIGCLITGFLISLFTNWGFCKHKWVFIKWILTVLCILVGTFVLGPTVNEQPEITLMRGIEALAEPVYRANYFNSLLGGSIQVTAILFMVVISVIKPWKGKKVGASGATSQNPLPS
jgi:hypothetical protein